MDTTATTKGRRAAVALAAVLMAGTAIGLAGCQSPKAAPAGPVSVQGEPASGWQSGLQRELARRYGGIPADRVAEEIARRVADGELPDRSCDQEHIVEHPDGGYHLVCIHQKADH